MPSIKDYNVKLASLSNTRKITRTMKMVSASKLRRAQDAQRNASLYAQRVKELIGRLSASLKDSQPHPLLEQRRHVRRATILLLTSDRGLCGSFNNGLIKHLDQWLTEHGPRYDEIRMSFCGLRGYSYYRLRQPVQDYYEGVVAAPTFTDASRIANDLSGQFTSGETDEVYLAYNVFKSALSQTPTVQKLLPASADEVQEDGEPPVSQNYLFEPDLQQLLRNLLPRMVYFRLYYALLEHAAGEHGARMTAMDNATSNAESMIESYTLLRNRARQAAITNELIEIISGAEAL